VLHKKCFSRYWKRRNLWFRITLETWETQMFCQAQGYKSATFAISPLFCDVYEVIEPDDPWERLQYWEEVFREVRDGKSHE
jgi:hypothetical protein